MASDYEQTELYPEKPYELILGSAALAKSCVDRFDYALKLSTGECIRYEEAIVMNHEWVRLCGARDFPDGAEYPRDIDVRISAIVWVKDAPFGS